MIHYVKLNDVNPQRDYTATHGLMDLFMQLGEYDRWLLSERVEMSDQQLEAAVSASYMGVSKLVLAKDCSKVLGFIATDKKDPSCISAMFVLDEYRGKGIGTQLVRRMKQMIPGKARVNAVITNERAVRFYQRQGFIPLTVSLVEVG